jgi:NACHT domain- and WD repeat-containing protein
LLVAWLNEALRTLQPQQRIEVLTKFRGCPYPLYLKLAFEEARRWKSWDRNVGVMGNVAGILGNLFDRLEKPQQHGTMLVSRALGYLAASRHGLTEDELLDVLSADKEVLADFQKRSPKSPLLDRLPVVLWARLIADLEPYMTQRQAESTTVLTFYHRQVGEVATTRYLGDGRKLHAHQSLARYFCSKVDPTTNRMWDGNYARGFNELPYQQASGGMWSEAFETLTSPGFLEGRCLIEANSGYSVRQEFRSQSIALFALISDFEMVARGMPHDL